MKKILSIAVAIAAIFAIASCGGNEKKADPAAKSVEAMEKLYEQLDDTPEAFIETFKSLTKYYDGLSESDQEKFTKAQKKWTEEHPEKALDLARRLNSLYYYNELEERLDNDVLDIRI